MKNNNFILYFDISHFLLFFILQFDTQVGANNIESLREIAERLKDIPARNALITIINAM